MSTSRFFLSVLLSSCFIGIFGHEKYEQVSHVCKSVSPLIYRDYLNGTDYKTENLIFTYERKSEHDDQCDGHVYLSMESRRPFTSDEIRSISRDYNFTERLVDVFGKIDVSQNEKLEKKFEECKMVLDNDLSEHIDVLNCFRMIWCHEYDFHLPQQRGPIVQDESESRRSMALKKLLHNEITCNPNAKTFSTAGKSLIDKVSEDIESQLANRIPLPAVQTEDTFSPYGNYIFTEKIKRDKSWVTVTGYPHKNYRQLDLAFNYNIKKSKIEYADVVQQVNGTVTEPKNYCVSYEDVPVMINITMNFEETYCTTFVQGQKAYLYVPDMRHCETDEVLSVDDALTIFFDEAFFGDGLNIVLTQLNTFVKRIISQAIDCENFRLT